MARAQSRHHEAGPVADAVAPRVQPGRPDRAGERSMPTPDGLRPFMQQRDQQAARAGPEIEDAQTARAGREPERSAASTTVSVSGRGTSVSGARTKGRPQNSRSPRMRATGSRARRRRSRYEASLGLPRRRRSVPGGSPFGGADARAA